MPLVNLWVNRAQLSGGSAPHVFGWSCNHLGFSWAGIPQDSSAWPAVGAGCWLGAQLRLPRRVLFSLWPLHMAGAKFWEGPPENKHIRGGKQRFPGFLGLRSEVFKHLMLHSIGQSSQRDRPDLRKGEISSTFRCEEKHMLIGRGGIIRGYYTPLWGLPYSLRIVFWGLSLEEIQNTQRWRGIPSTLKFLDL